MRLQMKTPTKGLISMKTPSNPCLKHPSSIPQAMLSEWAGVSTVRKKRSRKHRYVIFLDRKGEVLLAWKRLPYPKQAA
jgi:hypothetical protein